MKKLYWVICFMSLAGIISSCTSATLNKKELFAEYNGKGRANYYRFNLNVEGRNSKAKYRSGWYSARAVDDLFGNIASDVDIKAATAEIHGKTVKKTFEKYMNSLLDENEPSKKDLYKANYEEALSAVSGVASVSEDPLAAIDHANEKFVMMFANDPDAIIKAINNRMKGFDIVNSVNAVVQGKAQKERLSSKLKLSLLAAQIKQLQTSLNTLIEAIPENATNQALINESSGILAEMEVVR